MLVLEQFECVHRHPGEQAGGGGDLDVQVDEHEHVLVRVVEVDVHEQHAGRLVEPAPVAELFQQRDGLVVILGQVRVEAPAAVRLHLPVEVASSQALRTAPLPGRGRRPAARAEAPLVLVVVRVRPVAFGEHAVENLRA